MQSIASIIIYYCEYLFLSKRMCLPSRTEALVLLGGGSFSFTVRWGCGEKCITLQLAFNIGASNLLVSCLLAACQRQAKLEKEHKPLHRCRETVLHLNNL